MPNSTFKVRVTESYSAQAPACSEVPQGQILDPILFMLFVDDLIDVLSGIIILFTDNV